MTETIRVYFLPVSGVPVNAYHQAIVYDKGDGSQPTVMQATPKIDYTGTESQMALLKSQLWQTLTPFGLGGSPPTGGSVNSPYGTIVAGESLFNESYNSPSGYSRPVMSGIDLSAQWSAIQCAVNTVNGAGYAYLPLSQNSNSFADFALKSAGIAPPNGVILYPGGTLTLWVPGSGYSLSVGQDSTSGSIDFGGNYTVGQILNMDYHVVAAYDANMLQQTFYDYYNDSTSSDLVNTTSTTNYGGIGSFYDPIGAFYESTSPANDPAPSIATSTPRLLNASGQGVSEYGLSTYDANADNKLSGAELTNLRGWIDANENGIAETGEIKTLANAGITEIRQINYIYYAAGNDNLARRLAA